MHNLKKEREMKKDAKTFDIEETGLEAHEVKQLLIEIIDHQINHHKLTHLGNWVRNHNTSPVEKDQKIKRLQTLKNEVCEFLSESDLNHRTINFSMSFDLKFSESIPKNIDRILA